MISVQQHTVPSPPQVQVLFNTLALVSGVWSKSWSSIMGFKFCCLKLSCIGSCNIFSLGEMLASYFWLFSIIFSSSSLMRSSTSQPYLVLFCTWLCFLKIKIARCFGKWLFKLFIHHFALFYIYNRTFKFHLIMGQVISLCFFSMQGSFATRLNACLGVPRKIYVGWTSDLGDSIHSGDVSLGFTSFSRCIWRLFRCCFVVVLCSRHCCLYF